MPKNIVLCSDGTGNTGILGRGTNVFKLYESVDLEPSTPDRGNPQIAFYGDGVGTESVKWLRLLTGAFGIGVRRKVKQLYKQLARVYDPGDQIYLFGFSRGAYTVRMLAGLIAECGIIKSQKLSDAGLEEGADAAFDALRSRFHRLFLVRRDHKGGHRVTHVPRAIARFRARYPSWLPDGCPAEESHPGSSHLHLKSAGQPVKTGGGCSPGVRIRFVGVWDSVVAYGFPLKEVAEFWDRFIYPFQFPDTYLHDIVDHACHALSIDDERESFAPVLWQGCCRHSSRQEAAAKVDGRIEQVWFAGVHANVGGGYPKQGMSLVALAWMMRKAEEHGLRFIPLDRQYVENHEDVHDKLYDSRSGLAAYYRYYPRDMESLCKEAGLDRPTVHYSVLERIRARTDEYAPVYIPEKYDVDRTGMIGVEPAEIDAGRRAHQLEIVKDAIWWRRVVYYALVWLSITFAAYSWYIGTDEPYPDVSDWDLASRALHVALQPLLDLVGFLTPQTMRSGLNGLRHHPFCTLVFAGLFTGIWFLGKDLARLTRELGFRAWRGSLPSLHGDTYHLAIRHTAALRFAHVVRRLPVCNNLAIVSKYVLPVCVLLILGLGVAGLLGRWLVPAFSIGFSSTPPVTTHVELDRVWTFAFDTADALQPTPVLLEPGHQYRIEVLLHTPWVDRNLEATPTGILNESASQKWLGFLRRDARYPWFHLLGSVGTDPATTFPVGLRTVILPQRKGRLYLFVNDVYGLYHNNEGTAEIRVERLTANE